MAAVWSVSKLAVCVLLCLAACSSQREWTDRVLQENTFNGTFSELQNLALMICKENFILSLFLPKKLAAVQVMTCINQGKQRNGCGKGTKGKKGKVFLCTYVQTFCFIAIHIVKNSLIRSSSMRCIRSQGTQDVNKKCNSCSVPLQLKYYWLGRELSCK